MSLKCSSLLVTSRPPVPNFEELKFSLIQHENLLLKKDSNSSNDVSHEVLVANSDDALVANTLNEGNTWNQRGRGRGQNYRGRSSGPGQNFYPNQIGHGQKIYSYQGD